jgi:hypothetical protein
MKMVKVAWFGKINALSSIREEQRKQLQYRL